MQGAADIGRMTEDVRLPAPSLGHHRLHDRRTSAPEVWTDGHNGRSGDRSRPTAKVHESRPPRRQLRVATSSEGGWFAGFPAGIFWMAAWLLIDSVGLAIMIMVSMRVLGMRPTVWNGWSLRTVGLALLVALPGLAVVSGAAAFVLRNRLN